MNDEQIKEYCKGCKYLKEEYRDGYIVGGYNWKTPCCYGYSEGGIPLWKMDPKDCPIINPPITNVTNEE